LFIYLHWRCNLKSERGCSKRWTNLLTSAGENHADTSVRLHRMSSQQEGRANYRRESVVVTSLPLKLYVSVSPLFSLQPCLTLSVTRNTGLHIGPWTLPQSSCSTAWTRPWTLSATTISHHLHTNHTLALSMLYSFIHWPCALHSPICSCPTIPNPDWPIPAGLCYVSHSRASPMGTPLRGWLSPL